MPSEIERKFLVSNKSWQPLVSQSHHIVQGYLSRDPQRIVRVRIIDRHQARLTIKGAGFAHTELEYPIALQHARRLLRLCVPPIVIKTRYIVVYQGSRWEIDRFSHPNPGLMIAELEIDRPNQSFIRPPFIGEEVTGNPRYANANMTQEVKP